MTFDEAVAEINDSGWYIHQLCQNDASWHQTTGWECCLRARTGGYRREISRGKGDDPILAMFDALGRAPELEDEIALSTAPKAVSQDGEYSGLLSRLGMVKPVERRF